MRTYDKVKSGPEWRGKPLSCYFHVQQSTSIRVPVRSSVGRSVGLLQNYQSWLIYNPSSSFLYVLSQGKRGLSADSWRGQRWGCQLPATSTSRNGISRSTACGALSTNITSERKKKRYERRYVIDENLSLLWQKWQLWRILRNQYICEMHLWEKDEKVVDPWVSSFFSNDSIIGWHISKFCNGMKKIICALILVMKN